MVVCPPASGQGTVETCPPPGSVPLIGNSEGVVFAAEPTLHRGTTYSCSLATGARFRLDDVITVFSPGGAQLRLDAPARVVRAHTGPESLPVQATPDPRYWIIHMGFALEDRRQVGFYVDYVPRDNRHEIVSYALEALRPPGQAPAETPVTGGDRPGPPLVDLTGAATQRLPALEVTAETDEPAALRADAIVTVPRTVARLKAAQRKTKTHRLATASTDAPARTKVTLRLRVPGRVASAIRARLKGGRRATARIGVLATDLAGNQSAVVRTIRITR